MRPIKSNIVKIFTVFVLILRGYTGQSQGAMPVKDNDKRHQIEREVAWREWDGHTPKWFYWLIELLQKDKYRDKDRRNILQLVPTLIAVGYNKKQTDDYKGYVDTWAEQETFKLADYEIDVAYTLIKKDLIVLRGYLVKAVNRAQNAGAYTEMITEITNERDRIEGRIYTIRHSDLPNVDRREEYFAEMKQYGKLIDLTNRIARAFETIKK